MKEQPWLTPLGIAYGALGALRVKLYAAGVLKTAHLEGPVISVGNLRLGGTGKTPLVIRCAEILRDAGLPVAILSRGYGGTFQGECLVVSDGATVGATPREAGDEPVMMARALPGIVVAVGHHRDRVGRVVEQRFGRRVHVLDDGFQHLRLSRDLDLLCLGPGDLNGAPVPAGRLREFPSAARRADILLGPDAGTDPLADPNRMFHLGRRIEGFATPEGESRAAPRRPFLLSGIAAPERFHADVREKVEEVAGSLSLPDHHAYQEQEVAQILERARDARADAVVTTAKDAVRLPRVAGDPPVLVLRIAAQIDDEARFAARLLAVARRAA